MTFKLKSPVIMITAMPVFTASSIEFSIFERNLAKNSEIYEMYQQTIFCF